MLQRVESLQDSQLAVPPGRPVTPDQGIAHRAIMTGFAGPGRSALRTLSRQGGQRAIAVLEHVSEEWRQMPADDLALVL